jgi:LPXTG-site transpeptidase (sortase) family protein
VNRASRERRRRRIYVAALVFVGLALVGAAAALALDIKSKSAPASIDSAAQSERQLPPPRRREATTGEGNAPAKQEPVRIQMPPPKRIEIPAIGVSAPVIPLGLEGDRTLEVPEDFSETGWFTGGPEPGERGAAVIVGHVDSKTGPAVFYRLRALRPGDVIEITLEDRSTVQYRVTSSLAVRKSRFPSDLVYAQTRRPTLRLITCDGPFNSSTGHYRDNYIVFATTAEHA